MSDTKILEAAADCTSGDDAGLARLALAAKQINGVELIEVTLPDGPQSGLPSSLPVAVQHGENAGVSSVKKLIEEWRFRPERKSGTAKAQTLEAFIALSARHQTTHSAIFADVNWKAPKLTTVIDYHQSDNGTPDFGRHRVDYQFPLSEEWQAWIAKNGQGMSQESFAAFIEDHIAELSAPTDAETATATRDFATTVANPAELIQLSRGLQVHVSSKVKTSVTLQSGEGQIAWEESHNGTDGKPIKVPGMFILAVAPFFMGEVVRIPVRLRYRVKEGVTVWFYQIYRPDMHITERVRHDLRDAKDATGLPTFEAQPEMSAA